MTNVNWSNVTDFNQIPALANTASDGSFWVGMLYMIWIILMLLFSYFGFEVSVTVGTFLALILGFLLVYADLVAFKWVLTFVGILLAMFLYIIWSSNKVRQ